MKQQIEGNKNHASELKKEEYLFWRFQNIKEKEKRDKEVLLAKFQLSTKGKEVVLENSKK